MLSSILSPVAVCTPSMSAMDMWHACMATITRSTNGKAWNAKYLKWQLAQNASKQRHTEPHTQHTLWVLGVFLWLLPINESLLAFKTKRDFVTCMIYFCHHFVYFCLKSYWTHKLYHNNRMYQVKTCCDLLELCLCGITIIIEHFWLMINKSVFQFVKRILITRDLICMKIHRISWFKYW